jgi:hypothetical protein
MSVAVTNDSTDAVRIGSFNERSATKPPTSIQKQIRAHKRIDPQLEQRYLSSRSSRIPV